MVEKINEEATCKLINTVPGVLRKSADVSGFCSFVLLAFKISCLYKGRECGGRC